ncbi:hypothetical protein GBAR_LOCUS24396 [Geodia barretti]|uniref:Uncharacterized protein n=1 Tax=Geodia barretti TaxID=519541 RepID=A0AA35XA57_GEOBA|nr:hypothetical protein GBAR_LOCUS24396 [Geodia barretti]
MTPNEAMHKLRPKEEKGPSEPDEQVVLQPVLHHGEPGALLVVGEERRNRGIPRELLGLLNQGTCWQETEEENRRTAKIVKLKATLLNRNGFRFVYQELKPATYQLTCSNANAEFSVAM